MVHMDRFPPAPTDGQHAIAEHGLVGSMGRPAILHLMDYETFEDVTADLPLIIDEVYNANLNI